MRVWGTELPSRRGRLGGVQGRTPAARCRSCLSFFFQAEDGIRDLYVTGVQTCALPILGDEAASLFARLARETLRAAADSVGNTGVGSRGGPDIHRRRAAGRARDYLVGAFGQVGVVVSHNSGPPLPTQPCAGGLRSGTAFRKLHASARRLLGLWADMARSSDQTRSIDDANC